MIDYTNWNWVVNTNDMTCRNVENKVIVIIEGEGANLKAKLHDMPMELFAEIAGYNDGEKIIEGIVTMAKDKYLSSINRA
jgi:hypothetical protein